ncbi:hypothetical protein [Aeromicrobium sp. NPDC092404]|uniref:hypothetical protein n=1 Tax=Aeromicrobium sp. NPDC092404 TaxID=3154976 RepID=UPI003444182B
MPLLRRLLLSVAATLLLGVAAGFVWERLASPAEWEARETGLVMDEAASQGRFGVIVVFVIVGVVTSLLLGAFSAWTLRDLGWIVTPVVILLTVAAAVIAWRVGVHLGPPDPASVKDVAIGDRVPAELAVDGLAPFLLWPILGLVGFIGTMLLVTTRDELRQTY